VTPSGKNPLLFPTCSKISERHGNRKIIPSRVFSILNLFPESWYLRTYEAFCVNPPKSTNFTIPDLFGTRDTAVIEELIIFCVQLVLKPTYSVISRSRVKHGVARETDVWRVLFPLLCLKHVLLLHVPTGIIPQVQAFTLVVNSFLISAYLSTIWYLLRDGTAILNASWPLSNKFGSIKPSARAFLVGFGQISRRGTFWCYFRKNRINSEGEIK